MQGERGGISYCSWLLLPLGKSCISSRGSYKNVSVLFGVLIHGLIMFAQLQITQHQTDRPPLSLSPSLLSRHNAVMSATIIQSLSPSLWFR
jgi:hypothetical protein